MMSLKSLKKDPQRLYICFVKCYEKHEENRKHHQVPNFATILTTYEDEVQWRFLVLDRVLREGRFEKFLVLADSSR